MELGAGNDIHSQMCGDGWVEYLCKVDLRSEAKKIAVPTLIIVDMQDAILPLSKSRELK